MSRQTPRHKFARAVECLVDSHETGEVIDDDFRALIEMCAAYDDKSYVQKNDDEGRTFDYADILDVTPRELPRPPNEETKSSLTLRNYLDRLRRMAAEEEVALTDHSAENFNQLLRSLELGTAPWVKDEGLTNNTVRTYQTAVRAFLKVHDDICDREEIEMYAPEETPVDVDDMFTKEEIEALREATDSPRNRALLEMLISTGQRLHAIQSLKVKHVDINEGTFRLNSEATDGLKGADSRSRKRPLLGAKEPVRQWLQYHPCRDDDDFRESYLFTAEDLTTVDDHGEMLSEATIRYHLKKIRERAGIDKRLHAHRCRHYFVTVCKREYDMDNDTIKALIGHDPESRVMETTYQHLSMDDHIQEAEEKMGIREGDDTSSLTPNFCNVCNTRLNDGDRRCPACGTEYAPDAKDARETIEELLYEAKGAAETEEEEISVDEVRRFIKANPWVIEELDIEGVDAP